jgi:PAS domain S-box-containing protein
VFIDRQGIGTVQKTENNKKTRLPSETELEIRNIIDAFPFSAQLIDSDRKIVAVNETLKQALGMEEDQLIGAHCSVVIHGLNIPATDCPLEEALEKRKTIEREFFDSKNRRWINASFYPTSIVTIDGMTTYLHFLRDITEAKNTAAELSRSLEHHKALCDLLQNLQNCQNRTQILDTLIDQVLSLSWLGMAATAVGFVLNGKYLELRTYRNISPELLIKCRLLAPGECLCGKAAESNRLVICSSNSHDHNIKYKGMAEHQHAVFPISHKGNVLGVLTLYLNPGDTVDGFRLGFLEAATAAAGAALEGQLAREQVIQTQEKYLAHIISSQEAERKRVAGDLHDELCQSLSAILLQLHSNGPHNTFPQPVRHDIESQVRDLIDQVRSMAGQLRPAILDDFGLESALTRKIEEISSLKGIPIDFQSVPSTPKEYRLPPAVEVGLYRVAMEALINAVTHTEASHISVILLWQQNTVTLLVEDDGCGFDYSTVRKDMDRCDGLIEMEERMIALGGKLQIESDHQKGTTVRAEVPLETIPQKPL